jgi:hypothetical protein
MKEATSLWLEFEGNSEGYPTAADDPYCDFCNASFMVGAERYAVNIWTYAFLEVARRTDVVGTPLLEEQPGVVAPDLFVKKLDRPTIERAIAYVIQRDVPSHWKVVESSDGD